MYKKYKKRKRAYGVNRVNKKPKKSDVFKSISQGISTASQVAKLAGTVANIIGVLNTEKKYIDQNTAATPNTTINYRTLAGLVQGTGESNRIGHQVKFVEIHFRSCIIQDPSATNTFVRFGILLDRQPNGGLPQNPLPFVDNNIDTYFNPKASQRYKVLFDKKIALSSASKTCDFHVKSIINQDIITKYTGNSGTVTDIISNNIVFFSLSNEGTNTPTIDYNVRLRYVDN